MLRGKHVNIVSKILDLSIYLYICYDENEAPSICNNTVYLSVSSNILENLDGGLKNLLLYVPIYKTLLKGDTTVDTT